MEASKVSRATLEEAAREAGVLVDLDARNAKGTRWRCKLYPRPEKDGEGNRKWQAVRVRFDGHERRTYAVCWHGFRDFFRAVYRREPDAVFATALDTWRGSEDFERRFRASGDRNVGSQVNPVRTCDSCNCPESGGY